MSTDTEFYWEDLAEEDDEDPGYENFSRIEFNLWTDDEGVLRAAREFTDGMDGHKNPNQICMMVVLLNLYRCWLLDPEKWLAYMRRKGSYRLYRKYNKNEITYTGLTRCFDYLRSQEHIEHALGFYYRGVEVERGKCSRARLFRSFAEKLEEEYGFTDSVIRRHPDEEVIILKDKEKVPMDYTDTGQNNAAGKRRFLKRYNELLENTDVDLDVGDYRGEEVLRVDLSRKHNYRVYSNGKKTLIHGGRFYGGWWQGIPSELRKRIIINNMKVVECDYSGIHIYLLYAEEGVDFNSLGKDPYQLPEYEPTKEMRNFFKVLLLTALNADNLESAKKAMNRKYSKTPFKFPKEKQNLEEAIEHFKKYHKPISHRLFKGVGHKLMNKDSEIAEYVLRQMTDKEIPVLSVHDSFICPKINEEELQTTMRDAFMELCAFDKDKASKYYKMVESPLRTRPSRKPTIKIKYEEQGCIEDRNIYNDEYMYDVLSIKNSGLIRRIIKYDRDNIISKFVQVVIPSNER